MTERVDNTLGHGQRGYVPLVHVGTNNGDKNGTSRILQIVGRETEKDKS